MLECVRGEECPYGLIVGYPEAPVFTPAPSCAQGRWAGFCFRCRQDVRTAPAAPAQSAAP